MELGTMTGSYLKAGEETDENVIPYANSPFRQQKVPACKPFLTPLMAAAVYGAFALISLIIGSSIMTSSDGVFEAVLDYSQCPNGLCSVTIDQPIEDVLYLYYQLDGFHQNRQAYIKSVSWPQYRGKAPSDLSSCSPVEKDPANETFTMVPCGARSLSVFNDTFHIVNPGIQLIETGISQSTFRKQFKPINSEYQKGENYNIWLDSWENNMTNEHFINWVQIAATSKFRKLYGIIDGKLVPKGTVLNFTIADNYPTSNDKSFKKQVVLAETYFLGGKNNFFGIFYIVLCVFSAVAAIVFLILYFLNVLPLYQAKRKRTVYNVPLIP